MPSARAMPDLVVVLGEPAQAVAARTPTQAAASPDLRKTPAWNVMLSAIW